MIALTLNRERHAVQMQGQTSTYTVNRGDGLPRQRVEGGERSVVVLFHGRPSGINGERCVNVEPYLPPRHGISDIHERARLTAANFHDVPAH